MQKSFRTGNNFTHHFSPDDSILISPQNIKLEIRETNNVKKLTKFDPLVGCARNIVFSSNSKFFLVNGGCNFDKSTFKIFETKSQKEIDTVELTGHVSFIHFVDNNEVVYFGNWYGQLQEYNLGEKKLRSIINFENAMLKYSSFDNNTNLLYFIVQPKVKNDGDYVENSFVAVYDFETRKLETLSLSRQKINGIAAKNEKMALISESWVTTNNKTSKEGTDVEVYDLKKQEIIFRKKTQIDTMVSENCITLSCENNLAYLSNDCIIMVNLHTKKETSIPFNNPTSVAFSNNGRAIAVGGEKAKVFVIKQNGN